MLCAVIKGPSKAEIKHQLTQAKLEADLVELRFDHFDEIDPDFIQEMRTLCFLPMIFTLRSQSQGGNYKKTEGKRLEEIEKLALLKPDYLDLEYDLPDDFIKKIHKEFPRIKIILSYHDYSGTPSDIEQIYQGMAQKEAIYYKIAAMAHSSLDTLRLLKWAKQKKNVIAIAMGKEGEVSRVLAPVFGTPWTYAFIEEKQKTAEGQISIKILRDRYNYHHLNGSTAIYCLIGDPVSSSISDVTHNQLFAFCDLNAVYLKIKVASAELEEFLELAKELEFRGISVTMPLKELVLTYLDEIDLDSEKIGAVNTLVLENKKYKGFNTDGIGAVEAIEYVKPLLGSQILILGAGGAAKAIAHEALKKGAEVVFLNRDQEKAVKLARKWHCKAIGIDNEKEWRGYDVLINATPMDTPPFSSFIHPHTIVMDVKTKPKETLFLKEAAMKDCILIYGYQMFLHQAIGQFNLWFSNTKLRKGWEARLEERVIKTLE